MNKSNWRPVALSLTVTGALARLIPHPPNFAPVGAVSLFAGARLPLWQACAVPIALMAITDPILNTMHGYPPYTLTQVLTYVSFLISVMIGRTLRNSENAWRIGGAVLVASAQFFLISNLGPWYRGYPHTAAGLAACYAAALPFFGATLLSDAFFSAVLFSMHAVLSRTVATRERVPATA